MLTVEVFHNLLVLRYPTALVVLIDHRLCSLSRNFRTLWAPESPNRQLRRCQCCTETYIMLWQKSVIPSPHLEGRRTYCGKVPQSEYTQQAGFAASSITNNHQFPRDQMSVINAYTAMADVQAFKVICTKSIGWSAYDDGGSYTKKGNAMFFREHLKEGNE